MSYKPSQAKPSQAKPSQAKPSQAKPSQAGRLPYICVLCGGHLAWDSSSDAKEILGEYDDDDEAVVNYFHCLHCGRDYEIVDPVREEREKNYTDYWVSGKNTANNGKK